MCKELRFWFGLTLAVVFNYVVTITANVLKYNDNVYYALGRGGGLALIGVIPAIIFFIMLHSKRVYNKKLSFSDKSTYKVWLKNITLSGTLGVMFTLFLVTMVWVGVRSGW